ncbi:MAG: DUF4296 domain-containing protein [Janthinobacterium lividum]
MRFYNILFSLLLLFLCACNREPKPDNLIEEDRFVPLLVDIHLADGYLSTKPQMPDSLAYRANGLYAAIFKRHQVDSAQFKKSYQYYAVHLEQMGKIYTAVLAQLTAKNDSITKHLAAEEMKRSRRNADSVKKAFKVDSAKQAAKKDSVKKANSKTSSAKPTANHK